MIEVVSGATSGQLPDTLIEVGNDHRLADTEPLEECKQLPMKDEETEMATRENVILGSKFCRDCGGVITTKYGEATCKNSPDQGKQKIERRVCRILGPEERNFCEHCGYRDAGPVTCSNCGEFALLK